MMLAAGTHLGPYEILEPLGAGGMGEVYRARDVRLDRSVAIKTMATDLAMDVESRQRFDVEARAVSALSHPNICALFDVGRDSPRHRGGPSVGAAVDFLVFELVAGESLADRLIRGPLPLDVLWRTAEEIAGALDAAHARGITHRDLKPGNVMMTKSGAKLLDFGLAKLRQPAPATEVSQATRSFNPALTAKGAVLGTFAYMAPEQIEGKAVDARADIFAFGALLYEMATGRPAFDGNTQAALTASILARHPPPASSVQPSLPANFDHLVERCLAKDPDERWQSARDVLFELRWVAESSPAVLRSPRRSRTTMAVAAALTTAGALAGLLIDWDGGTAADRLTRLQMALPPGVRLPLREARTSIAVSPDGRFVAMAPMTQGTTQLWVRALDEAVARPLAGTEDALVPFWSPDSQWIGFRAGGTLKRVSVSGGIIQTICEGSIDSLPSWGSRGSILFTDLSVKGREGIFVVPAAGGEPKQVTQIDRTTNEREHFWPSFLPDGEHFFFLASRTASDQRGLDHTLYVASVNGDPAVRVADIDSRVLYVPTGHVLFADAGTVMAQQFDTKTFQLRADPIPIVEDVQYYKGTGMIEMSASANGVLAVQENFQFSELVWLDRAGRELGVLESGKEFGNLRFSPSGHRIAVEIVEPSSSGPDLYVFDRDSGIPTRFTSGGYSSSPVWSPDGETMHFRSGFPPDLFQKRANGRGGEQRLQALGGLETPLDVSNDGRLLVYSDAHRTNNQDLWLLPLGGGEPMPYLTTVAWETAARFSPDSEWLAFVSTESGSSEVYVAPVDDARAKYRVSAAGGIAPRWGRGGKELLYITPDGNLVSVPLLLGRQVQRGTPTMMFKIGSLFEAAGLRGNAAYELTPDGQRLLVNRVLRDPAQAPLTLLTNWTALLPR